MNVLFRLSILICILLVASPSLHAAPYEVLSDISIMRKGGVDAVRIDFALPVHYESHFPVKHGKTLTVNIRFSKSANIRTEEDPTLPRDPDDEIIDLSELPLLQTLQAPDSLLIPLRQVTYFLEDGQPKLLVEFNEDVNFSVSQVMGINSLVIFLPSTMKPESIDKDLKPIDEDIRRAEEAAKPIAVLPPLATPSAGLPQPSEEDDAGELGEEPAVGPKPEPAPEPDEEAPPTAAEKPVQEDDSTAVQEPAVAKDTIADEKLKIILNEGRLSLKNGDNKRAIQIFTKLLSLPEHIYSQASLELLGVARERNDQAAQAKLVYEQYLKKYPKGDGAARVNQRLAELLISKNKPKKRLKKTKTRDAEKEDYSSEFYGSFGQFFDYGGSETDETSFETDSRAISSQFVLNHRYRSKDLDVRSVVSATHERDLIDDESDGIEIETLYSKLRYAKKGIFATLGRQRASTAGVSGRFDGVTLGYLLRDNLRLNAVYGYPFNFSDKTTIQTNKRFLSGSVEFNNYLDKWDFVPYFYRLTTDNVLDRQAIGTEVRYFDEKMSAYGLLDYDVYFGELNWFLLNGTYLLRDFTSISILIEDRKRPNIETSNVLKSLGADVTLDQLVNSYADDVLKEKARERTDDNQSFEVNVSHQYHEKLSVTANIRYNKSTFKLADSTSTVVDDIINAPVTTQVDKQWNYGMQAVLRELIYGSDTLIGDLSVVDSSNYVEVRYTGSYRFPIGRQWRTQLRLSIRDRNNDDGQDLRRIIPSVKVDSRLSRDFHIFVEAVVEDSHYLGDGNNIDQRTFDFYIGYDWLFD